MPPTLLLCPTIARPSVLVQLPHVASPGAAVPSEFDPVRMSCTCARTRFPCSSSEFLPPSLFPGPCRSSRLVATCVPLLLNQGPCPMRSRALTAACPASALVLG